MIAMAQAQAAWLGFVDDAGNFAIDKRREFLAWVKKFSGQEVVVTVKKRPTRQGSQLMRWYRGPVLQDIAEASGYIEADQDDLEQIHQGMAWKLLRLPDGPMGEPRRRSTAKDDLSQEEMSTYVNQVVLWAETNIVGCRIRRPEECDLERVYVPAEDRA